MWAAVVVDDLRDSVMIRVWTINQGKGGVRRDLRALNDPSETVYVASSKQMETFSRLLHFL